MNVLMLRPTAGYPMPVVRRAREHHEAGWSLRRIQDLLTDEFGARPGSSTVHAWVKPELVRVSRDRDREMKRRRSVERHPSKPRPVSPERALARMRALHRRGLSPRAIGQVAAVWWGEEMTDDQVRGRLAGRRGYRKRAAA